MIKKLMIFASIFALQAVSHASDQNEEEKEKVIKNSGKTLSDYDDFQLLEFRTVNKNMAKIVDLIFLKKASIKLPLNCLMRPGKSHPYPHTPSYFARKKMQDDCIGPKFKAFCGEWNYIGKQYIAFLNYVDFSNSMNKDTDKKSLIGMYKYLGDESVKESTHIDTLVADNDYDDFDQDRREINLIRHTFHKVKYNPDFWTKNKKNYNELFELVKSMPELEQKEIGFYYLNIANDAFIDSVNFATTNFATGKYRSEGGFRLSKGESEEYLKFVYKTFSYMAEHGNVNAKIKLEEVLKRLS